MKIVIAPDSFKGSLSSKEAAEAMQSAVLEVLPKAQIVILPISDGGEGAAQVLATALPGRMRKRRVSGPYGNQVEASYFLADSGLGVIELAEAAGLTLIAPEERSPIRATTLGVGELMLDALKHGATSLCLTLGGSATNDGGAGIARALGILLLDEEGKEVAPSCAGLAKLYHIDTSHLSPLLQNIPILIACDVQNPLCGPKGASHIYGPQKGADAGMIHEMDEILSRYEKLLSAASGKQNLGLLPGSGAAGGAALPLLAFLNAQLVSGIDLVLNTLEFEKKAKGAALVLTGEGKIDRQTSYGKAIAGVISRAQALGVHVAAFGGVVSVEKSAYPRHAVSFYGINPPGEPMEVSLRRAKENLRTACTAALKELL